MKIVVLGRGNVGGGLARMWQAAGHEVETLAREGGDASDADVVVVAVPSGAIADALSRVRGIEGKTAIDAANPSGQERAVRIARGRGEGDRRRPGRQGLQCL